MYHPSHLKQSTRDRAVPHSDPLTLAQKLAAKQKSLAGYLHLVEQYKDKKPLWASINQKAADKVQAEIVSLEQAIKLANETYALEAPTVEQVEADEANEIGSWLPTLTITAGDMPKLREAIALAYDPNPEWVKKCEDIILAEEKLLPFAEVALDGDPDVEQYDPLGKRTNSAYMDGTDNSAAAEMRNAGYDGGML